ncbi:MAG: hypothetical protein FJ008_05840 [Chloroflexi bacterium]|nr:hypothetical protein [Chloroflexota bacterium]
MTISTIRTIVRRDLKDEDSGNYRWTDNEIDRAIARALEEFSLAIPREMKSTVATTDGSAIVDISGVTGIANLISVDKLEYPIDSQCRSFRRISVYQSSITMIDGYTGDGGNSYVYWSSLHTLDSQTSTVPTRFQNLLATGAAAYAVFSQAQYQADRANIGGDNVDRDYLAWARERLSQFKDGLRLHGRRGKLRQGRLYPETDYEGKDFE